MTDRLPPTDEATAASHSSHRARRSGALPRYETTTDAPSTGTGDGRQPSVDTTDKRPVGLAVRAPEPTEQTPDR